MTRAAAEVSDDPEGIRLEIGSLPEPFDPFAVEADTLERHCLPPRTHPRQTPVAYANWVRAFVSRPQFPTSAQALDDKIVIRTYSNRSISQASSRNWSGAFVRPKTAGRMTLVQGRWIVPDTPPHKGGVGFASSVWVGLDGYDPASRIIPQIGTGQAPFDFSISPVPGDHLFTWWQLWLRDEDTRLVFAPVEIERHHRIYAQVHVLNSRRASLFLKNETTNHAFAACVHVPSGTAAKSIEQRTAEWIVERPLTPETHARDPNLIARPLTDYGETAFTDCNAVEEVAGGLFKEFQLERARLIRVNAWDEHAHPGRLVSRPERIGGDAVQMTYVKAP